MIKKRTRTNWHEAITCAIQIDLRDYAHLLEYYTEYTLSANGNHIDMLIVKKQSGFQIPKHIASIFRTHNLFEIKGLNASLTTDAYYKTNGHAGYYIDLYTGNNTLKRNDITLTFPTLHYPRNLFIHLRKDCNKTIENPYPGVYYVLGEMYATQILVISELSPEDSLYLYCLAGKLTDSKLINSLTQDYTLNKENEIYIKYMHQFLGSHMKGEQIMVCENLFKLYGTSSKEITENATKKAQEFYVPQIEKLTSENTLLSSENTLLTSENTLLTSENTLLHSEIAKFKKLLAENNISY